MLHKLVVENGGNFSMNLNNSVTLCVAAESKGIKFQAAKLRGDVIHYSWLLDCCSQKKPLPLHPKYFLHLSEPTKKKLGEEIDEFSDSYYVNVDIADIQQLLSNIVQTEDSKTIDNYKKKYCPKDKWARFHDCCIYFFVPLQSLLNSDWKILVELALRRMKLEVSLGGGRVSYDLSHATHLVVMSAPGLHVDFNLILNSLSATEKCLLRCQRLHIVASQWLEECLKKDQKLPEDSYSLKPNNLEELLTEDSVDQELNLDGKSGSDIVKPLNMSSPGKDEARRKSEATTNKPRLVTLPKKECKTKRGRPSGSGSDRRKVGTNQPRRVRARLGNKAAKIYENESDDGCGSSENFSSNKEAEERSGEAESHMIIGKLSSEMQENPVDENLQSSQRANIVEQYAAEHSGHEERVHEIGSGGRNGSPENEKLQYTIDPVQAVLQNMIPSLGNSKAKNIDYIRGDGKLPIEGEKASSVDPGPDAQMSGFDPKSKPEKKKRVSYRDVAGELLKDW